jgi:hypothetical protein
LKTTYGQTIAGKKLLDGAYATGKVKKPTMSRTQFEEETYEYAKGGGLGKPTYIPNADIDSLKTTYGQTIAGKKLLDGAYATGKVKKPTMSRTQFEEETYEYKTGGTMDAFNWENLSYKEKLSLVRESGLKDSVANKNIGILTPTEIASLKYSIRLNNKLKTGKFGTAGTMDSSTFKKGGTPKEPYSKSFYSKSDWEKITAFLSKDYSQTETNQILNSRLMRMTGGDNYRDFVKFYNEYKKDFDKVSKEKFSGGGSTEKSKQPIAFESSNLYFNGFARDINGNSVIRLSFPSGRAFSFQLNNGGFPITYKAFGQNNFSDVNESEINAYVKAYGSPAQKKKLKIYKK